MNQHNIGTENLTAKVVIWNNQNARFRPLVKKKGSKISMTIPNQAMPLKRLLEVYVRGGVMPPVQKKPQYFEEDFPIEVLEKMDRMELLDLMKANQQNIQELREKIQKDRQGNQTPGVPQNLPTLNADQPPKP